MANCPPRTRESLVSYQKFLPKNSNSRNEVHFFYRGFILGGLAMSETSAGSDVMSMRTTAVKKGDYYVLNGSKFWITNGPIADYLLIYAKTNPTRSDGKSITAFLVDTNEEGFTANHIHRKLA